MRRKKEIPSRKFRKQFRIAAREEVRLQRMLAILPPKTGNRSTKFSSALIGQWQAADDESRER